MSKENKQGFTSSSIVIDNGGRDISAIFSGEVEPDVKAAALQEMVDVYERFNAIKPKNASSSFHVEFDN